MDKKISITKGYKELRKNRLPLKGCTYFLTFNVRDKKPFLLKNDAANIVAETFKWVETQSETLLHAYVIMPEHVHLVITLIENGDLAGTIRKIKSYTGNKLSVLFNHSPFWQDGYYDHAIKCEDDFKKCIEYIINNPIKRGLVLKAEEYKWIYLKN